jgi:hypothetical protein
MRFVARSELRGHARTEPVAPGLAGSTVIFAAWEGRGSNRLRRCALQDSNLVVRSDVPLVARGRTFGARSKPTVHVVRAIVKPELTVPVHRYRTAASLACASWEHRPPDCGASSDAPARSALTLQGRVSTDNQMVPLVSRRRIAYQSRDAGRLPHVRGPHRSPSPLRQPKPGEHAWTLCKPDRRAGD